MTFASVSKGEGPSRGLLCDCDIFMNLRLTFVWSSTMDWLHVNPNLQLRRLGVLGPENDERYFTMLVRRWELSCFNVKFFILCVAAFKLHGTVHSDVAKNTCPLAIHLLSDLDSWHHGRSAEIFFTDCQNFGLLPCILYKVLNLEQVCVLCLFPKTRKEFLQIFNPNKILRIPRILIF